MRPPSWWTGGSRKSATPARPTAPGSCRMRLLRPDRAQLRATTPEKPTAAVPPARSAEPAQSGLAAVGEPWSQGQRLVFPWPADESHRLERPVVRPEDAEHFVPAPHVEPVGQVGAAGAAAPARARSPGQDASSAASSLNGVQWLNAQSPILSETTRTGPRWFSIAPCSRISGSRWSRIASARSSAEDTTLRLMRGSNRRGAGHRRPGLCGGRLSQVLRRRANGVSAQPSRPAPRPAGSGVPPARRGSDCHRAWRAEVRRGAPVPGSWRCTP